MEELRSTEALDNEIKNESRKKAARILENAEEKAKELLSSIDERISEAEKEAQENCARKLAVYERNLTAAIPLEKQRFLISYIHNSVLEALNNYFDSIGEDKRLQVVEKLLVRVKDILADKKVDAKIIGINKTKATEMLKKQLGKQLGNVSEENERLLFDEAVEGFNRREGIILTTEDNKVKCSLTLDERVKEILDEKNQELAEALFGGRLPE